VKYVVAVSGGIDSVVLLHQLAAARDHDLVVAHFDHGIRPDSAADARFVEALAASYGLLFVGKREELGARASEELARARRYDFLRRVAQEQQAVVATAHHGDDVVETIAINLSRGTGWRGLAVLNAPDVERPLLGVPKRQIYRYALDHRLEWVEDSTNTSLDYLRNRLRRLIQQYLSETTHATLQSLRHRQVELKAAIDNEVSNLVGIDGSYDRYFITQIDAASAGELLQAIIYGASGTSLTRPQCERALLAIKTARPGTRYECGGGVTLRFQTRTFIVETS
jgi:tRNA(Ile)-lysidine synthase